MIDDRNDFKDSSTLEATVSEGYKKETMYHCFSILAKSEDGSVDYPVNNVLYEYIDEIKNLCVPYTIPDSDYSRYCMRPDLFCYDNYGDSDLDWILLAVNDIISHKSFTMKNIMMVNPEYLDQILSDVLNASQTYMNINKSEYETNSQF